MRRTILSASGPRQETNGFVPFMHKRRAYADDNEVRVCAMHIPTDADPESTLGIGLPWSPAAVLEAVWVSPEVPSYFFDIVRAIVRRMAPSLEGAIRRSGMCALPEF